MSVDELFRTADWKTEKHVPVIECQDTVPGDDFFELKVSLGKEVAHPNTTEHHIRWIRIYFKPADDTAYEVGSFELTAHGESATGPNIGPVYTHHGVSCSMKTTVSGRILAMAYCNIHGLWENAKEIQVS